MRRCAEAVKPLVHARVNQREEVYHAPFWLHIAHGHVEIIICSYIG